MRIEKRTMYWLPKPSAWQQQQRINARNKAHTKRFLENQTALASNMFAALDSSRQAATNLMIQAAAQRVSATASAAKSSGLSKLA